MGRSVEQRYFERQQESVELANQVARKLVLEEKKLEPAPSLLTHLISIPLVLVPEAISYFGMTEAQYWSTVGKGAKYVTKRNHTLLALVDLRRACRIENRGGAEINIDSKDAVVHKAVRLAFIDHEDLLTNMVAEGREEAVSAILAALQTPETPLVRWRRDIAKLRLDLKPIVGGRSRGEIALQPTILEEVYLKLLYLSQDNNPRLSLLVNPILGETESPGLALAS